MSGVEWRRRLRLDFGYALSLKSASRPPLCNNASAARYTPLSTLAVEADAFTAIALASFLPSPAAGAAAAGVSSSASLSAAHVCEPWRAYMRLYAAHRRFSVAARAALGSARAVVRAEQRRYCLRVALDGAQFACGLGGYACYIPLWLLLLLARSQGAAIAWPLVFAPLAAAVLHPYACASLGALTECCAARALAPHSLWRGMGAGDAFNLVHYAQRVKNRPPRWRGCPPPLRLFLLCCAVPSCLLAAIGLISARLEAPDLFAGTSWALTLLPVWFLIPAAAALPFVGAILGTSRGDEVTISSVISIFLLLFLAPTLGTVCAILDGADIQLAFALAPLFFLDLLGLCGGAILVARALRRQGGVHVKSLTVGTLILCVAALGIAAQTAASVYYAAGDMAAVSRALLVPALLLATVLSAAAAAGALILWRRARRRSFVSLYTAPWRTMLASAQAASPAGHGRTPFLLPIGGALRDNDVVFNTA